MEASRKKLLQEDNFKNDILESAWRRYDELAAHPEIFFKKHPNLRLHSHQLKSIKRRLECHSHLDSDAFKFIVTSVI